MLGTNELPKEHFSSACTAVNCGLERVHRRLQEAHRLWHQAADHYFDPDAFASYLNSAVQSLRNLTFILQANKSKIPDFDTWYGPWQERFKSDSVMKWLRDARTQVVHQDDLATTSTARCKVLTGWHEPPVFETELSPMVPTRALAELIATKTDLSEEVRQVGVVVVDRRWVEKNLPDHEMLTALGHCYALLAATIDHLHKPEASRGPAASELLPRVECMEPNEFDRTVCISLSNGDELIVIEGDWQPAHRVPPKEIENRYKMSKLPEMPPPTAALRERALFIFEMAKRITEKDGYHRSVVLYFTEDGKHAVHGFDMADRAEILVAWRVVAANVRKMRATSIISIGEGWLAPVPEDGVIRPAEESPERKEILQIDAVSRDGEQYTFWAEMTRKWGRVRLGPMQEWDKQYAFYLEPVRAAWKEIQPQ